MEVQILMPRLGSEMTRGTIVEWLKKEGDKVKKGEPIFMVDTEKAVVEVESEFSGVLRKILEPEKKQDIPVGQAVAIFEKEG